MQISFPGANQFKGELSMILALMKNHFKSQGKYQDFSNYFKNNYIFANNR